MADSLSSWLALREAADAAARSVALTRAIVDRLPRDRPPRIVDLGTGTGSNVRYLANHLPGGSHWLLVDRDPALLSEATQRIAEERNDHEKRKDFGGQENKIVTETREMNLGVLDPAIVEGRDLVTASALLDLVSETWLRALASACRRAGAAALFALTYNGRSRCSPAEPEDDAICDLLNRHQRHNDKGFGRAAGPDAAAAAERWFAAAGYHVERAPSDWVLAPDARDLQRQLIEGWAEAAREIATEQTATIDDWLRRRLGHVDAGRSHVVVCHDDLAAWLPREHPVRK
jgi:SAM-dependent methyltransferase